MKTFASTSTLFVMCVGCGVLSLGFGSCGSASSGGIGEVVPDGGLADTGARDVGTGADSSSVFDTGSQDAKTPDGGDEEEAGSCGEPHTMLGATCDGCIQTNCDPMWCACVEDSPDAGGDAGSGCLQYAKCVEDCVEDDAGSPTDCLTTVCAVAPFTTPQQQAGHAFLDCLVQYCGSECGQ